MRETRGTGFHRQGATEPPNSTLRGATSPRRYTISNLVHNLTPGEPTGQKCQRGSALRPFLGSRFKLGRRHCDIGVAHGFADEQ